MQTYEEYLRTMKAYGFCPVSRELWQEWQIDHHGFYKEVETEENKETSK